MEFEFEINFLLMLVLTTGTCFYARRELFEWGPVVFFGGAGTLILLSSLAFAWMFGGLEHIYEGLTFRSGLVEYRFVFLSYSFFLISLVGALGRIFKSLGVKAGR
jgi:hypothetical protein